MSNKRYRKSRIPLSWNYSQVSRISISVSGVSPDHGEPWTQWQARDYMVWNPDVPHTAISLEVEPRYTLQLAGWMYHGL